MSPGSPLSDRLSDRLRRRLPGLARCWAARVVAVLLIVTAFGFARLPRLDPAARAELAARFAFERHELPEPVGEAPRTIRDVHPSLQHLAAWISSVGAAVALADLDGDGLANDLCHVDTRYDRVGVAPAPGTGERYAPFVLEPSPLPYDPTTMAPMGCVPGDLDEDGREDLLVYYWGRSPVAFLAAAAVAPGRGAAGYRPVEIHAGGERWYTNAATRADLDGDGHADLVFGNYFQDGARILDASAGGTETMQHSMSRSINGGSNRVLLWAGAGARAGGPAVRYRQVDVLPAEVARGWTLALGAADLDGDLLPELYFANDFGADRLLHNRSRPGAPSFAVVEGRRGLATVRSKVLGRDSFKGMGVDFADVNGDGLLDLYVSNIAAEWSLEESHFVYVSTGHPEQLAAGRAPYVDRGEALGLARSGWGWESRFADFDNDGTVEAVQATGFVRGDTDRWPELHELAMGNDQLLRHPGSWPRLLRGDDLSGHQHNPFFVRSDSGRYFDLAAELGMQGPQVSRGIATADVDGDGRLDFAVANQWEDSFLYRNRAPGPGAFLGLRLLLPTADGTGAYPAVGAQAVVRLPDGRRLVGQVDGGNGHSGVRSPELHFGLGAVGPGPGASVPVELAWRDADGRVRRATVELAPGRHTLLLDERLPHGERPTRRAATTDRTNPPENRS
ncbi:MAG TPA: CRTAC1 family protein [Thermoanaerobaculia bacterium]|nr:CRTAC1 family protein [Thermoanaerobaculia bacterium]